MAEAQYSKPSSTLDLEARQAEDYVSPAVLQKGEDPVLQTENGFIGVDPIYQNFSDVTHKPFVAEGGAEAEVEKPYVSDNIDTDSTATPEGEDEAEEDAEDESTKAASGANVPQRPTPPGS